MIAAQHYTIKIIIINFINKKNSFNIINSLITHQPSHLIKIKIKNKKKKKKKKKKKEKEKEKFILFKLFRPIYKP